MTFRQNASFVNQYAGCVLMMVVSSAAASAATKTALWYALVCCIVTVLSFVHTWRTEPRITMDDRGVRCFTKTEVLWYFPWSEIAEIRQVTHLRSRAIQLVPIEARKQELEAPNGHRDLCIQLSRAAKQALERYCPGLRT